MSSLPRAFAVVTLAATAACDTSYVPPCRVTSAEDVGVGAVVRSSLVRSRDRVLGTFVEHAAALSRDDARAVTGLLLGTVTSATAAIGLERVELPPDLAERRDGVGDLAVVRADDGRTIVAWVEVAYDTEPDGRVIPSAALRVAPPGVRPAPAAVACRDCTLAVAVVPAEAGDGFVAVTRRADVVTALGGPPAVSLGLVRIGADGAVVPLDAALPLAASPFASTGAAAALSPDDLARGDLAVAMDAEGRLLVREGGQEWSIDASLTDVSGPFGLPSADAVVARRGTSRFVAFSRSPFEDGRSGDKLAKRDVFLELDGRLERASAGRLVLGFDRDEQSAAVAFESAGATWLSVVDARGAKRGGDVLVRASTSAFATELGVPRSRAPTVVLAPGASRFVVVDAQNGSLRRTEVTCGAP